MKKYIPLVSAGPAYKLDPDFCGDPFELTKDQQHRVKGLQANVEVYSYLRECYEYRTAWITVSDQWAVPMICTDELSRIQILQD